MSQFSQLIREQMETMDKIIYMQNELERCREIEAQLVKLQEHTRLTSIQEEIQLMKKELIEIHDLFEKQTEELIRAYQQLGEALKN